MALTNFKNGQVLTETELNNIVKEVNGKAQNTKATTSQDGLMSKEDKTKLDGVATGANKYTHPTNSGNKHIPTGGSAGQILVWSEDGVAKWGADKDTKYTHPTGDGNNHIPAGGASGQILRWSSAGTAVWGNDNNTTYSAATESALGLVKKMPTQADSTASDVAGLVEDFNALLAKLKSAGLMS
jgi:hypothetical protein